jgi:hypothetical protein
VVLAIWSIFPEAPANIPRQSIVSRLAVGRQTRPPHEPPAADSGLVDSDRQNRQNIYGALSARGDPRIDVKPHGQPTAVSRDDRLWPNPAELQEALQRLPHDARLCQPGPVVAVDLAGGKRARQPPSSQPTRYQGPALAPRDTCTKLRPGAVFRSVSNSAETRTSAVASTIQSGPPQPLTTRG